MINFSNVIGSIGENGADHVHYNIRMQQLSCSVLAICSDTRYLLVEAQELAEFFKTSMLQCVNGRDGNFHLCYLH